MGTGNGRALGQWSKRSKAFFDKQKDFDKRFKDSDALYSVSGFEKGSYYLFFYDVHDSGSAHDRFVEGFVRYRNSEGSYTYSVGTFESENDYADYIVSTFGDFYKLDHDL